MTILPILSDVTHTRNVIGSLAMASDVSYALGNSAATMFWCFMLLLFSSRNGSVWTPDRTMASEVIFCAAAVWLWKHFPPFFLHVLSIILLLYYYVSFWEHDAALLANKMGRENVIIYLLPPVIRTGKYSYPVIVSFEDFLETTFLTKHLWLYWYYWHFLAMIFQFCYNHCLPILYVLSRKWRNIIFFWDNVYPWWWQWQWVGNYSEIFVTKTLPHTLDLSSWPFAPSPERRKGNILWTRSGKKRCFHFLGIGFVLWAIKVKVNTDFIQFFSGQEYTIYI